MSYIENRVKVSYYGRLSADSALLVKVPTTPGHKQQKLHTLAAKAFKAMSNATVRDLKLALLAASGWRPHRWLSRRQYEDFITKKYGSAEKGRLYLAYDSPHETGLAVDIGCGGLYPDSSTIEKQKATKLFKWLVEHAWEYGVTNFFPEPWHWEYNIPLEAFKSGTLDQAIEPTNQSIEPIKPIITLNDVCDDNMCLEVPWDLDYISKA